VKCRRLSKNEGDFLLSCLRLTPTLSFGGEGDRGTIHIFVPILLDIVERFPYLFRLNPELFGIVDREPLTSAVDLKVRRKFLFKWGFL